MSNYAFGIDLGTTNSAISVYRKSGSGVDSQVIEVAGRLTTPSCVMYKDGEFVVGVEAYENRYKPNTAYSFKRQMGRDVTLTLTDNDRAVEITPVALSSKVIKHLTDGVRDVWGEVTDVTITVPAYFNERQRRDTKAAGELAGLNVVSIINEPTSASLAYGLTADSGQQTVLVYDLGGGTFDATLLQITKEEKGSKAKNIGLLDLTGVTSKKDKTIVSVIGNVGDNMLGGDDIDRSALDLAIEEFNKTREQEDKDPIPLTDEDYEHMLLEVEQIKKTGSMFSVTNLAVPSNGMVVPLRKRHIERAVKGICDKTLTDIRPLVEMTNKLDRIVLVGGSTKSQLVRQALTDYFKNYEVDYGINPDEVVAIGAAIQTYTTLGGEGFDVFDVVPIPVGVMSVGSIGGVETDEYFKKLVMKDTLLPVTRKYTFEAVGGDGDTYVHFYQGFSNYAKENDYINSVNLGKLEEGDIINITANINTNGILTVKLEALGEEQVLELHNVLGAGGEDKPKARQSHMDMVIRAWERNLSKWLLSSNEREEVRRLMKDLPNTFESLNAEMRRLKELQKERK